MAILPISSTNNHTFKGLWSSQHYITGADHMSTEITVENTYSPFLGESEEHINSALESKRYNITVPGMSDYEVQHIISDSKLGKELPIEEMEYRMYKKYNIKNLPRFIEKVESSLRSHGLEQYLNKNDGILRKTARFFRTLMLR